MIAVNIKNNKDYSFEIIPHEKNSLCKRAYISFCRYRMPGDGS